jgi:ribonucleoside-diphosphate reductase beta chain
MPQALEGLLTDRSDLAFVRALLNYHIIVEGVLAETGYHAIFIACQRNGILPGLAQGVSNVKRDESRHIAYGIYALQRIVGSNPALMDQVNDITNDLLDKALGVIPEALDRYGDSIPFGITLAEFVEYASDQFAKRFNAIERAVV